ncbi:hypothetical protein D3C76_1361680 [compost metagenome]|uniref:hypothetical protein n=1 Tax=Pseudomonas TaxID=286 RepID=UPI000F93FB41|nr:hypothetical protein [Pseudomonas putida]MDD1979299.1 hypothetical protein [Pseudomonas putida]
MIIEDDSFALGVPTPMEMLEQHTLLLRGENEQLQHDLFRARKNIEQLVVINQGQAEQITKLNGSSPAMAVTMNLNMGPPLGAVGRGVRNAK